MSAQLAHACGATFSRDAWLAQRPCVWIVPAIGDEPAETLTLRACPACLSHITEESLDAAPADAAVSA